MGAMIDESKLLDADARTRAMGYPYPAPPFDCVWTKNGIVRLTGHDPRAIGKALKAVNADPEARRTPVLAIGSNRSSDQLARKFHDFDRPAVVVARATLFDFDVVYGAGIAGYGAVGGATLAACPGAAVEVWTTWLDDAQLQRMHETEGLAAGVYGFYELQQISLCFAAGPRWPKTLAYVQRSGALNLGGRPVALAEIPAERRLFPALRQPQLQALLRDRFAPSVSVNRFVHENLTQPAIRRARVAALAKNALPFDWPHMLDVTPQR